MLFSLLLLVAVIGPYFGSPEDFGLPNQLKAVTYLYCYSPYYCYAYDTTPDGCAQYGGNGVISCVRSKLRFIDNC